MLRTIYFELIIALLTTLYVQSATCISSSARAERPSPACGEVPIVSPEQMLGHYHETTLDNMRETLLEAAVSRPDEKLAKTVAALDELRGLDWCSPENQRKAALLIDSLSLTLDRPRQHFDAMWPVTRRLIMGTLLQGLNRTSSGVISELQTAVDQVVQCMHQITLKTSAKKGIIHFMHVSKSAGAYALACGGALPACWGSTCTCWLV